MYIINKAEACREMRFRLFRLRRAAFGNDICF